MRFTSLSLAVTSIILCISVSGCRPVGRAPGPGDYTQDDVKAFVTPGRPLEEITNRFGCPYMVKTNGEQIVSEFHSGLVDTRVAKQYVTNGYVFSGFRLYTKDGKAVMWRASEFEKARP